MAESNSKLSAPLQKFSKDLKAVLQKTEAQIRELRAREASTKERPLQKHELCPLCGGPDINGRCKCIEGLQKNAMMGYGGPTPSPAPANAQGGLGQSGGGGTQPMGLSEKMGKAVNGEGDGPAMYMAEMCKNCGKSHEMGKCDMDEVKPGHDLAKKAPPGEEKLVHKLKDEYGHDKEGQEKAFATAWAIKNGTVDHKKSELAKMGMPTSSAAALAPKAPAPMTPISHVNAELGGAKSVFGTGKIGTGSMGMANAPKPLRKPVHAMGRPTVSVSGEIPNAKSELGSNPGSASKYGTGGPGHATQTNMPSALKASMAPTAKAELPAVKAAPEKSVKGAKMPPAKGGKKQDLKKEQSGGQILKKAAPALAKAPPGKGVAGKQPVGQGGGDAHKVASAAGGNSLGAAKATHDKVKAGLADVKAKRAAAVHPETAAGLADVKALRNGPFAAAPKAAAPAAAAVAAPASGGGQYAAVSQRLKANPAPGKAVSPIPDALQNVRNNLNLAADKKAGGVGFLRGLMSMFHSPKPAPGAPQQQGQLTSQRMHGAMPLKRAEKEPVKVEAPKPEAKVTSKRFHGALPLKRDEKEAVKAPEAPKTEAPKVTSKRFHGALPLKRGEDMRKAALSLTKKDLEADELDKGLNMTNHNRRLLVIKPSRSRKKNR